MGFTLWFHQTWPGNPRIHGGFQPGHSPRNGPFFSRPCLIAGGHIDSQVGLVHSHNCWVYGKSWCIIQTYTYYRWWRLKKYKHFLKVPHCTNRLALAKCGCSNCARFVSAPLWESIMFDRSMFNYTILRSCGEISGGYLSALDLLLHFWQNS